MSAGHTPGPWHASATYFGAAYDIGAEDGSNVALVSGCDENGAFEFKANAKLIAAAPELLAHLEWAETVLKCWIEGSAQLEAIRAAIAKATGEA